MELILIRGLPGSGKTTMARRLAMAGYEHHEAELSKAHAWCLARTQDSLRRGARCVVSNTFTRRWEMKPYFDAAKAAGVPVRVIEARGSWQNCHGVPAEAIERMRARWELADV